MKQRKVFAARHKKSGIKPAFSYTIQPFCFWLASHLKHKTKNTKSMVSVASCAVKSKL